MPARINRSRSWYLSAAFIIAFMIAASSCVRPRRRLEANSP